MGILTGAAFLDSLDDGRDIRIDGTRITDVRTDPRFEGGARTMAALYDMQHDPRLSQRLTYASPTTGDPVGLSFLIPKTQEDLVRRRDMAAATRSRTSRTRSAMRRRRSSTTTT